MKNIKIILAKNIGFCFGVKNAYNKSLESLKKEDKPCQMLGELVHNKAVVEELQKKGLIFISSVDQVKKGTVIIRAHGADKKTIQELKEKKVKIIDTTCILVKKAQNLAQKLEKEKRLIIIIGEKKHDEVKSIKGNLKYPAHVIEDKKDLKEIIKKIPNNKLLGVIAQTTQDLDKVNDYLKNLKDNFKDVKYENTLCPSVLARQKEVKEIAKKSDIVLVIGSKNSANTQRLVKIVQEQSKRVINIENEKQVSQKLFKEKEKVGIISGTSVPDNLIKKIIIKINHE